MSTPTGDAFVTDARHAPWDIGRAQAVAESLRHLDGACLPILHALQSEFGYIHPEAIPIVAETLNLSKAEVVGVVNFYSDFRQEPPAPHTIRVCVAEACQSMGSARVVHALESTLGTAMGEKSADQAFELEPVYCLGNCALSPALVFDGRMLGRVTPERATALLAEHRQ